MFEQELIRLPSVRTKHCNVAYILFVNIYTSLGYHVSVIVQQVLMKLRIVSRFENLSDEAYYEKIGKA